MKVVILILACAIAVLTGLIIKQSITLAELNSLVLSAHDRLDEVKPMTARTISPRQFTLQVMERVQGEEQMLEYVDYLSQYAKRENLLLLDKRSSLLNSDHLTFRLPTLIELQAYAKQHQLKRQVTAAQIDTQFIDQAHAVVGQ